MIAIRAEGLSKSYRLYNEPIDRLKEALHPLKKRYHHDFFALDNVSFEVMRGEVLGIVGNNGAGKSTLLKILTGVLTPTSGSAQVAGKIASLLELGAGFNPEYTGMENIYFQGTLMGFTRAEMAEKVDEIVAFADIGEFIHQSVKMYSSGMFARLAFAVATSVKPDILIIDEALSVGDGTFARKSFDRIMELKNSGCTIVFCSHTLYQVEMICTQVLWLDGGKVAMYGNSAETIKGYEHFMLSQSGTITHRLSDGKDVVLREGEAKFESFRVSIDGKSSDKQEMLVAESCRSTLCIDAVWVSDPALEPPSFAVTVHAADGRMVGSAGSHIDGVVFERDSEGRSLGRICFPELALLKGEYEIELYLLCDRGVLFYDQRIPAARFYVTQAPSNVEQGLVHLPRLWG